MKVVGDILADSYSTSSRYNRATLETLLRPLRSAIGHPDGLVLDIGAGTGEPGLVLRKLLPVSNCVAIDLSLRMLQAAKLRCSHSVGYVQANARRLPFPSGCADAIVVTAAFHLFGELADAMAELARVLASRGHALLIVYLPEDLSLQLFHKLLPRFHAAEMARHPQASSIIDLASGAGLVLESRSRAVFSVAIASPKAIADFLKTLPFFGMHTLPESDLKLDLAYMHKAIESMCDRPLVSSSALTGFLFRKEIGGRTW